MRVEFEGKYVRIFLTVVDTFVAADAGNGPSVLLIASELARVRRGSSINSLNRKAAAEFTVSWDTSLPTARGDKTNDNYYMLT